MDFFQLQLHLVWNDYWSVIQQNVLYLLDFFSFLVGWVVGVFSLNQANVHWPRLSCTTHHGVCQTLNAIFFPSKPQVLIWIVPTWISIRRRYWTEITSASSQVEIMPQWKVGITNPVSYCFAKRYQTKRDATRSCLRNRRRKSFCS